MNNVPNATSPRASTHRVRRCHCRRVISDIGREVRGRRGNDDVHAVTVNGLSPRDQRAGAVAPPSSTTPAREGRIPVHEFAIQVETLLHHGRMHRMHLDDVIRIGDPILGRPPVGRDAWDEGHGRARWLEPVHHRRPRQARRTVLPPMTAASLHEPVWATAPSPMGTVERTVDVHSMNFVDARFVEAAARIAARPVRVGIAVISTTALSV